MPDLTLHRLAPHAGRLRHVQDDPARGELTQERDLGGTVRACTFGGNFRMSCPRNCKSALPMTRAVAVRTRVALPDLEYPRRGRSYSPAPTEARAWTSGPGHPRPVRRALWTAARRVISS